MDKNFLESLVSEEKPESFQEEKRVKIVKERKPLKWWMVVIPLFGVVFLLVVSYFLFFAPKIVMENFIGRSKNDLFAYLRQQGIEASGVITKEVYNFEYDKDVVIKQSVEAGKKIKKDSKLNFEISKGADPEEKINLPDLKMMTKNQINDWIKENKLQNARINIVYDDKVAIDEVIKVETRDDDFKRNSSIVIQISKGKAPAGSVNIPDFKQHNIESYESLLKSKKLEVVKIAIFSNDNKQPENSIISVSPEVNKTVKEGDVVTVTYSKGKAIKIADFTKMNKEALERWEKSNPDVKIIKTEVYSEETRYVLKQSIPANTQISSDKEIELTLNLGKPSLKNFNNEKIIGSYFDDLLAWCNEINAKGYDIYAGQWNVEPLYIKGYKKGQIVSYVCNIHETEHQPIDCLKPLPYKARINATVSAGDIITITLENDKTAADIAKKLAENNIKFSSSVQDLSTLTKLRINGVVDSQPNTGIDLEIASLGNELIIYEGSNVEFK